MLFRKGLHPTSPAVLPAAHIHLLSPSGWLGLVLVLENPSLVTLSTSTGERTPRNDASTLPCTEVCFQVRAQCWMLGEQSSNERMQWPLSATCLAAHLGAEPCHRQAAREELGQSSSNLADSLWTFITSPRPL